LLLVLAQPFLPFPRGLVGFGEIEEEGDPPYCLGIVHRLSSLGLLGRAFGIDNRPLLLDRRNGGDDGALGGAVALGGERELAAQHRPDGRQRGGDAAVLDRDGAVGLPQRKRLDALERRLGRPPARIAGHALAKPRVERRLAVAHRVVAGRLLGPGHGISFC
jgi:hypothetical protein